MRRHPYQKVWIGTFAWLDALSCDLKRSLVSVFLPGIVWPSRTVWQREWANHMASSPPSTPVAALGGDIRIRRSLSKLLAGSGESSGCQGGASSLSAHPDVSLLFDICPSSDAGGFFFDKIPTGRLLFIDSNLSLCCFFILSSYKTKQTTNQRNSHPAVAKAGICPTPNTNDKALNTVTTLHIHYLDTLH